MDMWITNSYSTYYNIDKVLKLHFYKKIIALRLEKSGSIWKNQFEEENRRTITTYS